MDKIWSIAKDGKNLDGRYTRQELNQLREDANPGSMLVWKPGMEGWQEPDMILELNDTAHDVEAQIWDLPGDEVEQPVNEEYSPPEEKEEEPQEVSDLPTPVDPVLANILTELQPNERIFGKKSNRKRQLIYTTVSSIVALIAFYNPFLGIIFNAPLFIIALVTSFFFTGRVLNGWWPFFSYSGSQISAFGRQVLGPVKSLQRRLILAFVFSSYAPLFAGLGFLLTNNMAEYKTEQFEAEIVRKEQLGMPLDEAEIEKERAKLKAEHQNVLLGAFQMVLVPYLVTFYLLGFSHRWKYVGNHAQAILPNASDFCPALRESVCKAVLQRSIKGLEIQEVQSEEGGIRFADMDVDGLSKKQLELTLHRIRIAIRIHHYGDDLFVRWESFANFSGRRLWMLMGIAYGLLNRFFLRWFGTGIENTFFEIRRILFDWDGDDTSGSSTGLFHKITVEYALVGETIDIPSYMKDDFYAMEETVTRLIDKELTSYSVEINGGDENDPASMIKLNVMRAVENTKVQAF